MISKARILFFVYWIWCFTVFAAAVCTMFYYSKNMSAFENNKAPFLMNEMREIRYGQFYHLISKLWLIADIYNKIQETRATVIQRQDIARDFGGKKWSAVRDPPNVVVTGSGTRGLCACVRVWVRVRMCTCVGVGVCVRTCVYTCVDLNIYMCGLPYIQCVCLCVCVCVCYRGVYVSVRVRTIERVFLSVHTYAFETVYFSKLVCLSVWVRGICAFAHVFEHVLLISINIYFRSTRYALQ